MFLGYIEIPKSATRYLDMPEEKKRRRRKKAGSEEGDKEKTLKCETLHSSTQKTRKKTRKKAKKDAIKIEFNDGNPLRNWDYVANNYKTN